MTIHAKSDQLFVKLTHRWQQILYFTGCYNLEKTAGRERKSIYELKPKWKMMIRLTTSVLVNKMRTLTVKEVVGHGANDEEFVFFRMKIVPSNQQSHYEL